MKTVVPVVRAGQETQAKPTEGEAQPESTRDVEIVARIFVLPVDDAGMARAVGKPRSRRICTVPVYAAFHEWLGRGEELADLWRLWKEGDRKAAAESIPDHVVDQLLVWGKPEACREHLAALHRQRRHHTRARAVLRTRSAQPVINALKP